jgi:hypothetical protein
MTVAGTGGGLAATIALAGKTRRTRLPQGLPQRLGQIAVQTPS